MVGAGEALDQAAAKYLNFEDDNTTVVNTIKNCTAANTMANSQMWLELHIIKEEMKMVEFAGETTKEKHFMEQRGAYTKNPEGKCDLKSDTPVSWELGHSEIMPHCAGRTCVLLRLLSL